MVGARTGKSHRPEGPAAEWLALGLLLVLVVNLPFFSRSRSVTWDARDEAWFFLRWLGTCLREGRFGDFFPNVGSGFPVAANIVTGAYNPLYLLFAFLFPDSALSINLLHVTLELLTFFLAFVSAATLRVSARAAWMVGLSTVASGYFLGHTSHFSYQSTGLGLLACFLGLRLAVRGRTKLGFLCCFVGTFHLFTSGNPEIIAFGAPVLVVLVGVELVRGRRRATLAACGMGVACGLLLATPALAHFLHQLERNDRGRGLTVAGALSGSLPPHGLVNLFNPLLSMRRVPQAVDPTMDRFHLLAISPWLVLVILLSRRPRPRRVFWFCLLVAALFTLLALGRHSPVPLRSWLAQTFLVYRIGRFPSGQASGIALFSLALACGFAWTALERVAGWRVFVRRRLPYLVALDFTAVLVMNGGVRYMDLDASLRGTVPRFKLEYGPDDRPLLNAPRGCPFDPLPGFDQLRAAPDHFTWGGYTNLISSNYMRGRESMRWALCGPSRLWQLETRNRQRYSLISYSPSEIRFRTQIPEPPAGRLLLWAEVDDGFWELSVQGQRATILRLEADLRGIDLRRIAPDPSGEVEIRMVYRGPLSRLWRH